MPAARSSLRLPPSRPGMTLGIRVEVTPMSLRVSDFRIMQMREALDQQLINSRLPGQAPPFGISGHPIGHRSIERNLCKWRGRSLSGIFREFPDFQSRRFRGILNGSRVHGFSVSVSSHVYTCFCLQHGQYREHGRSLQGVLWVFCSYGLRKRGMEGAFIHVRGRISSRLTVNEGLLRGYGRVMEAPNTHQGSTRHLFPPC